MKIYVAHSKKINYEKDLYNPMKNSNICKNNDVFFPHDEKGKNVKTKDIIKQSDLVSSCRTWDRTWMGRLF